MEKLRIAIQKSGRLSEKSLELLKEAVEAGELDKVLMAAKEARRAQFKKAS